MKTTRPKLRLALGFAALSCFTAAACGRAGVEDERLLSTLTASELGELCDEVQSGWPSSDDSIECEDGSTVTLSRPPRGTCGEVDFSACPASVGELRECTRTLLDDPCSAFARLPDACVQLERAGCGDASPGGDLGGICPEAPADELARFEGVYELVSHERSELACDYRGESVLALDTERLFVIVAGSMLGRPAGVLESCSELTACRERVTEIRARLEGAGTGGALDPIEALPELARSFVCRADSPGAVLAQAATVGPRTEDMCDLTATETSMTRSPEGALRLESRTFAWQKPVVADECSYTAGEKPSSAACASMDVFEARFVSAL